MLHSSSQKKNYVDVKGMALMYNKLLPNRGGVIARLEGTPIYFSSVKNFNARLTDMDIDMILNTDGTLNVRGITLGSNFLITDGLDGDVLLIKKDSKTKVVVRDKGMIISDDEVNEDASNALLLLQSENAGLVLPRVTNDAIQNEMQRAIPGTIIYNKDEDTFLGRTRRGWKRLDIGEKSFCAPSYSEKDKKDGKVRPRPGMIIYNTTHHCVQVYSRKRWINVIQ